jgi:hypothetical protein
MMRRVTIVIPTPEKTEDEIQWMRFDDAVKEIAKALTQSHEVAMALMCGLCATGDIRCASEKKFIDPDKEPMGTAARPLLVSMDDFNYWLSNNNLVSLSRDDEIRRKLRAGELPGDKTTWKQFGNEVRDRCRGWKKKGVPARGFGDKSIQRAVREIQDDI